MAGPDAEYSAIREAWRSRRPDGGLIGCFPVYSPHELFHAAGLLPVGLLGGGTEVEIAHADSRFQSFVCSIAKSTLELALQGRLAGLDGAVFHSICDVARNLASVVHRALPHLHVEYIHLPQNVGPAAVEYLEAEYRRVLAGLCAWRGGCVRDDDLRASIRLYNRARRAVRELEALRRRDPDRLAAAEFYRFVEESARRPPDETERAAGALGAEAMARTVRPRDRVRVVLLGAFCERMPVELVATLEEAGCAILEDDLLLGWRWFESDVPETGDPVRALAESYLDRAGGSSVRHEPRRPREAELLRRVHQTGAQAVLYCPAKFCEPALFDYVLCRRALEAAGVPHLVIEFEEKMWTFDRIRSQIETFVESILLE